MTYRPTARVLTVLELLQAHGRMTGAELARRLEVEVRTIRNYIETLRDLGIPVETERGRYGAYRLRPGYKLPPLIFTEDEALALMLSLLSAHGSGSAAGTPAVAGALAKVERVLPEAARARLQAVERTVVFEDGIGRPAPPSATVATLSAAVQAGRSVHLRYRSARTQETERVFDPWGVVAHHGAWYTIGHCHARGGQRLFRLDRIMAVVPLDATFPRPANFDPLSAVGRALASIPSLWQVEVWLGAPLAEIRHRTTLPETFMAEVADGVLIHLEVDDLGRTARLLAGLGVPLVILRPPELRDVLHCYALALARDALRTGGTNASTEK